MILPVSPDATLLAAHVTQVMVMNRRYVYAHLAPDLTITLVSPNFAAVLRQPRIEFTGKLITEVLWEFVGAETTLLAVLYGKMSVFRLEQVNREQVNGEIDYLMFQITAVEENHPEKGLLLIVEDTSDIDRLYQTLIQERNQLSLLYRQLEKAKTFALY